MENMKVHNIPDRHQTDTVLVVTCLMCKNQACLSSNIASLMINLNSKNEINQNWSVVLRHSSRITHSAGLELRIHNSKGTKLLKLSSMVTS